MEDLGGKSSLNSIKVVNTIILADNPLMFDETAPALLYFGCWHYFLDMDTIHDLKWKQKVFCVQQNTATATVINAAPVHS